jgi:hypothetical protein
MAGVAEVAEPVSSACRDELFRAASCSCRAVVPPGGEWDRRTRGGPAAIREEATGRASYHSLIGDGQSSIITLRKPEGYAYKDLHDDMQERVSRVPVICTVSAVAMMTRCSSPRRLGRL